MRKIVLMVALVKSNFAVVATTAAFASDAAKKTSCSHQKASPAQNGGGTKKKKAVLPAKRMANAGPFLIYLNLGSKKLRCPFPTPISPKRDTHICSKRAAEGDGEECSWDLQT